MPPLSDALSAEPNMDAFFRAGHWGQCLELLSHLCQYSESVLLINGQPGIGKSALKRALIRQESDNFYFCEVQATANLTAENILATIDIKFDQPLDKDLVLLIDDAQNLPINVIAVLIQLKQRPDIQKRLHIVLFATPALEQRLMQSVLKEEFTEVVHVIELEPLSLSEMEAFLLQQFDLTLDKLQYKKIYTQTGGIPGKVKKLAEDLLHGKKAIKTEQTQTISPTIVGLTVCAGIIFCLLAVLWPEAEENIQQQPLTNLAVNEGSSSLEADLESTKENIMPQSSLIQTTQDDASQPSVEAEQSNTPTPVSDTSQPTQDVEQPSNPTPEIAHLNLQQEQITALEKQVADLQQLLEKEQRVRRELEAKLQQTVKSKNSPKTKPVAIKSNTKPVKRETNVLTKLEGSKLDSIEPSSDELYILGVSSKNYTLQLLGTSSEQKMQNFIKQHNLSAQAHYFKTTYQGNPWYVLIYGNYPNIGAATAAINSLPEEVKKLRPWPREYARIQNNIKK